MEKLEAIESFKKYLDKIIAITRGVNMIYWDMLTGGAPSGGSESRAKTIGILSTEAFALSISEEMKSYLDFFADGLSKDSDFFGTDTAARELYRIAKRDYEKVSCIPVDEYREFSELQANSTAMWEIAKNTSDFELFRPYLEKLIDFTRRFVSYRGFSGHPYELLLDEFEPGMTIEALDAFFAEIKLHVVSLLKKIQSSGKEIRSDFLKRPVPISAQKEFSEYLLKKLLYDFDRGMMRESEHPFTMTFGQNDVRLTTHFHENDFLSAVYSTIHECGHALYDQNVDKAYADTLLDDGASYGIHESQSRFYENVVGRSYEFWESIYDDLIRITGDCFKDVTAREFYEAANIVAPSLIRIEADELTYSLHIMVRYEIEKMLLENAIDAKDLPKVWNEKIQEYLGLTPPDDAHGVLQDVHWSDASFGYFPTYALGNAYGAQILTSMLKEFDLYKAIEDNDYKKINGWLTSNIHQYGATIIPGDLIVKVTGEPLSPKYFIDYLEKKYLGIYACAD